MNYEVIPTPDFERALKPLVKKYRSLKMDLMEMIESLENNPFQGDEIHPGIRKIRIAIKSKGKGKSGGARIITFTIVATETEGEVYLLDIYDKSDYSTIDGRLIQKKINELGLQ